MAGEGGCAGLLGRSWSWCSRWALWKQPRPVVVLVVITIAVAAAVTSATAFLMPVGSADVVRFVALAVCSWVSIELTRHIERRREHWSNPMSGYIDTKSVWSFAAVIVLPPVLASAMVVLTYVVAWFRIRPLARPAVPYRWVYSSATVLCGTQAAVAVLTLGMNDYPGAPGGPTLAGLADLGVIVVAGALRWTINLGLIMVAIVLTNPSAQNRDLFASFGEQVLEAGALGLGLVTAAIVVNNPFVMPGVVIAMIALHRGLLVNHYQQASRVDAKTGLATAGWWHDFAEQALVRARDRGLTLGILIVDLDRFKNVNDTFGHPHGDRILKAVAQELIAEIRDQDACGRWGGEEFVVVLPEVRSERNLYNVAERVRRRIEAVVVERPAGAPPDADIRVTASVGAAMFPAEGVNSLDELLLAADTALYAAKNNGRNAVRLHGVPEGTPPRLPEQVEPRAE